MGGRRAWLRSPNRDLKKADTPIPAGTHQVRMKFAYDGGGLAKGGDVISSRWSSPTAWVVRIGRSSVD
jgi:hypothetical protein